MKIRKNVAASELATFSFCERAWGYQRSGLDSENLSALERGTQTHRSHSKMVRLSRAAAAAAWLLLLASAVMILAWMM